MASQFEHAMHQADAHATLKFMDASLNPETEQMVRVISEISKPLVNANEPCITAATSTTSPPSPVDVLDVNLKVDPCTSPATSTSTPSMDAIDMYLMGVKEKRPVASLPTATLKSCFARTGPVAKLRKTKVCL